MVLLFDVKIDGIPGFHYDFNHKGRINSEMEADAIE
jgi:hypothetical protein